MKYINHLIEPNRLLLLWQAQDSKSRSRYIVGELVRNNSTVSLTYFKDTSDFHNACEHGFAGYPAFQTKVATTFDNHVIEAFSRRLPPRSRSDFHRYLELRGINPDMPISDFALLGYTGAKLPDDGFELVHPFDTAEGTFELIIEIAGFRHESEVTPEKLSLEDKVDFVTEPENRHDPKAIRIEKDGEKLGYVDRGRLKLFHKHIQSGSCIQGEIIRKNGTSDRPLIYIFTSITPSKN